MHISRKTIMIFVGVVLILGGSVTSYILWNRNNEQESIQTDTPRTLESDESDTQQSNNQSGQSTTTNSESSNEGPLLPQPTLSKSSGNNGSIPRDVLVQFSCSGVVNTNCYITLSDQNTGEKLQFDEKKLEDDGRGQVFATWVWESKPGVWIITATVTADSYKPNTSASQTLEVRQ